MKPIEFKAGMVERRTADLIRSPNQGEKRFDSEHYVEGYATTYDQPYEMYHYDGVTYYEQIDKGALDTADLTDVIMQFDHEGRVLARASGGEDDSLFLDPNDAHGLFVAADLSRSQLARDICGDINAGLITGMSWAFSVDDGGDYYDRATHTRHITKIRKVYDVSAVSIPANPDTEISARSYKSWLVERENIHQQNQQLRAKLRAVLSL